MERKGKRKFRAILFLEEKNIVYKRFQRYPLCIYIYETRNIDIRKTLKTLPINP